MLKYENHHFNEYGLQWGDGITIVCGCFILIILYQKYLLRFQPLKDNCSSKKHLEISIGTF